jgi:hypothetical protein
MTDGHDGKRDNKRESLPRRRARPGQRGGGHPGIGFRRDRDTFGCPGLLGGQGKAMDTMAGRPVRTATRAARR